MREQASLSANCNMLNLAQAEQYLQANKDLSASHNCYAYKLSQEQRASDDGEPSGTAGQPIMTAINAEDLNGVCVLVTRCRPLIPILPMFFNMQNCPNSVHCLSQAAGVDVAWWCTHSA